MEPCPARGVAQLHQPRLAGGAAADGDQPAEALLLQRLVVPHLHGDLGGLRAGPDLLGEAVGVEVGRGCVHPRPRLAHGLRGAEAEFERLPRVGALVGGDHVDRPDARLAVDDRAVAVGAQQRPLDRALDHLRLDRVQAHRDPQRTVARQPGRGPQRGPGGPADLLGGDVDVAEPDDHEPQPVRAGQQHGGRVLRTSPQVLGGAGEIPAQRSGEFVGQADHHVGAGGLGEADHEYVAVLRDAGGDGDGGQRGHVRILSTQHVDAS